MTLSVILACLWGLCATVVALLPWRYQFPPGIALLLSAPALIVFLGYEHGPVAALVALAGFVSMFRRPLFYLGRKALGFEREGPGPGKAGPDAAAQQTGEKEGR